MNSFVKNNKINYYNKDFSTIRENLINHAKSYFPHSGNDFTPASPSMMFIELAAYVGDLLSFYLDKQVQETFITTATERENIVQLANLLGYVHKNTTPSTVTLIASHIVPARSDARELPNYDYALRIAEGALISTNDGSNVSFRTLSEIDFSTPDIQDVFQIDGNDGMPTYYILQKYVKASAAYLTEETFYFPADTLPNPSIILSNDSVIEILDVIDSNGNVWYEVPYLAQQTVLYGIKNSSEVTDDLYIYSSDTPYLLKSEIVNKKFIRRTKSNNSTELIFGAGTSTTDDFTLYPNQENLNASFYSTNINNMLIDPNNFMYFNSTGEVPRDTTLTVRYYYGGGYVSNVPVNTITQINTVRFLEMNESILVPSILTLVKNSISFVNTEPALGGRGAETDEEIRQNAMAFFNAQNRCVTSQDYTIRALSLPQKYGNIAKAFAVKDRSDNFSINLFCLSYDRNKNFVQLNEATQRNLSVYIENYRVMSDSVNIIKPSIINIGVTFEIVVLKNYNRNEVLKKCLLELKSYFDNDNMQINKPIILSEVYNTVSLVEGVQSVKNIKVVNKNGDGYSSIVYPIDSATRSGIIYPAKGKDEELELRKSIFEVKYPNVDIKGTVVSY